MTEIMPFPENNYETVLLDRPFERCFFMRHGSVSRVLSLTAIYLALRLLAGSSRLLGTAGSACMSLHGVAPDRVYIVKPMLPWAGWALTPPFHPYLVGTSSIVLALPRAVMLKYVAVPPLPHFVGDGRYISVALVLGSPPAGVTRYPYPVEPGLSSSGTFRYPSAAVRPGR